MGVEIPHEKGQSMGLSAISCSKTAEPINLQFGLWTRVGLRKHMFNRIRQVAPMCPTTLCCELCEMGEPIDLPFGLLTQLYSPDCANVPSLEGTLVPPGEYD